MLDLLFMCRPVLVAVVLIFPLAGARGLAAGRPDLWCLLLQDAALVGAAFVLNQLHDLESDRVNGKCPTLARTRVRPPQAMAFATALLLLGLGSAWMLGPWHLVGAVLFFTISALAYNLPPLRAKDRPVLAPLLALPAYLLLVAQAQWIRQQHALSLENLLLGMLEDPELLGEGVGQSLQTLAGTLRWGRVLWASLPMSLAGLSLSFLSTVPDLAGDRAVGKRTWAVVHGGASAWRLASLLMGVAALLAVVQLDWIIALPALAALVLMVRGQRNPEERASAEAVLRVSVLLQGLALCVSWPLLAPAMLLLLLGARRYYRRRFQLDYPDLGLAAFKPGGSLHPKL